MYMYLNWRIICLIVVFRSRGCLFFSSFLYVFFAFRIVLGFGEIVDKIFVFVEFVV